jgi:hypothetical protein
MTKRPADYNLSGEILEFRMKELSILAGLRDSPCEILKVDPYLSVTEITEHLRRKFKQNNVVVQDTEVDLYDDYWAEYLLFSFLSLPLHFVFFKISFTNSYIWVVFV